MEKKEKRKRGGQKGNRNAAKQDYYSMILDHTERRDFNIANGIEGIDEEIALMRFEIKKAISGGDERNLLLLVKAAGALEKLIRTRHRISADQRKGFKEAIGNVIKEILLPMGVNLGSAAIVKKLSE
jgi:hypothetical protein